MRLELDKKGGHHKRTRNKPVGCRFGEFFEAEGREQTLWPSCAVHECSAFLDHKHYGRKLQHSPQCRVSKRWRSQDKQAYMFILEISYLSAL